MGNKAPKLSTSLIGISGVHFVVSELTLRGLIALPTIRNTGGIDILVSEPDGSGLAALQVKTSLKRKVDWWPSPRAEKCLTGPTNFYVFLRYLHEDKRFEAFLETGKKVAGQVRRNEAKDRKRGWKDFPWWGLPSTERGIEELRNNWATWRPPQT